MTNDSAPSSAQAAFKGLFPYRPRVLMRQISRRINSTPIERRHHIARLNTIGREIPKLHEKYQAFQQVLNFTIANGY